MVDTIMLKRVLIDGSVLSLALGVITLVSLRYNPRLWLNDYPKALRDKVSPLTNREKRDRLIAMTLILGIIVVVMTYSALQLKADNGGSVSFGKAYLTLFLVFMMFNLFDAVVIDLFYLTLLKPKFVILPGMEGMEAVLYDYRKQVVDFLKGFIFCGVISLPFAVVAVL